jgi:serine/threonine-protein kinase RsbW
MCVKNKKIKLSIESDLKNVSLIGLTVNSICLNLDFDKETSYQLELCVVEAVNNCILHAYEKNTNNDVEVVIELHPDKILFKVCDAGKVMEAIPNIMSALEFDPCDPITIPECGRGLFIIHKIMDDITYERFSDRNILTMTKRF